MVVFVGKGSPYKTLKELIAAAQAAPGKLNWATTGIGSVPHLSVAAFLQAAQVQVTHVPFRGEPQLLQQLVTREIGFAVASISGMAGKGVRALAVFSDQRHTAFPDVPTMAELCFPAGVPVLNGMFAPRGIPERGWRCWKRLALKRQPLKAFVPLPGASISAWPILGGATSIGACALTMTKKRS